MLNINSSGQTGKTFNSGISKCPGRGEAAASVIKDAVAFGKKVKVIEDRQYLSVKDFLESNGLTRGRKLGVGAFGEVSLINDPSGSLCVMKTKLDDNTAGLCVDELNARLFDNHDGVATVYAGLVEKKDGKIELAKSRAKIDQNQGVYKLHSLMIEYVKGKNLADYLAGLENGQKLSREDIYNISFQLCHAMGKVSERKVIHRDLKLENIMYDPETKKIKVIDFGLSVVGTDNKHDVGTSGLIAPEILDKNCVSYDSKADAFSLGAALIDLMCDGTPACLFYDYDNKMALNDDELDLRTNDDELDSRTNDDELDSLTNDDELDSRTNDDELDSLTNDDELDSFTTKFSLLDDSVREQMIKNKLEKSGFDIMEYDALINVMVGLTRNDPKKRMSAAEASKHLSAAIESKDLELATPPEADSNEKLKVVRSPSKSDSDYSSMSETSRADSLSADLFFPEPGWNPYFVGALIDSSVSESEKLNEEITEAGEALKHSNEEVRQLNEQLAQKECQIQTLSQETKEEIAKAREAIEHSNEEVRELKEQLDQKESQIQTLSQETKEDIAKAWEAIEHSNEEVRELKEQLDQKESQIQTLSQETKEEITKAGEALKHSNEEVRQLKEQLAQKECQIQTLSQEKNCVVATLQTMSKNFDALNFTLESDVDTGTQVRIPTASCPLLSRAWNSISNAWSGYSFF